MVQTEKNKIFNELNDNIKTLQEIIKQQEKLLIDLLTELDKVNGKNIDFTEDDLND